MLKYFLKDLSTLILSLAPLILSLFSHDKQRTGGSYSKQKRNQQRIYAWLWEYIVLVNAAFFMRITFSRHFSILYVCAFLFALCVCVWTLALFLYAPFFRSRYKASDGAFILSMVINSSTNNTFLIETEKRLNWNLNRAHEPREWNVIWRPR